MIDSKVCFEQRVNALGLSTVLAAMKAKNCDTYGNFAYATSFVPGAADDAKFIADIVVGLGLPADSPLMTPLKRLHNESYTFMLQDLQQRTVKPDDEVK